jgi:peroxiredoxin
MKKNVYVILLVCIACNSKKTEKTFEVQGTIKNTSAKIVYLEENIPEGRPTIMDSAQLKTDGTFIVKAPTKEESLYQLRLSDKLVPFALLVSDAAKIKVQADLLNTAQPYVVEGSAATQSLIDFDKKIYDQGMKLFLLGSKVDSLSKAHTPDSLVNADYAQVESAASELKTFAQDFFTKSNSPVVTLYALSSFQNTSANLGIKGFSKAEMADIVNAAAAKFPTHAALQNVKKNWPSAKAPDFTQPDVNGKPISLSSFKGKYVLLDFWASWCKPCRIDNPDVVKAYNEFKDKNFTVFGVSLDQSKEAWLQAIQQDGLTWTHASDLKFWSNEAAVLYGVQGIPANFLIDPQGNIIAQDLHGEEIVRTLRSVIN